MHGALLALLALLGFSGFVRFLALLVFFGAALGADCFIALFFVHLALLALSYT